MKYPGYPEYKSSKAEWIGHIPSHWEEWKVSHGFGQIGSGTTPKSDNALYYGGNTPWVTTAELRESIVCETTHTVTQEALDEHSTLKKYPNGSVVIAMYGATIGRLGMLGIEATVNQACCVFSAPEKFHPRFFYFWLWMRRPILISLSSGGGQPNLNQEELKRLRVPLPSINEQQQIAAFLDWKTGQIDALTARKKELLEKLKEKRLAVITQAVTKGLDPAAPLRDSGISWLGQVPEHWEVKKLKFIGDSIIGLTYDPNEITDEQNGTLVLRANNIQDGKLVANDALYVSTEAPEKLRLRAEDILICSRNGSRHLIGKCGRVTPEFVGCYFGAFNTVFRSKAADYIYYVLNSSLFEFQSGSYLTSTINQLTIGTLNSFVVPLPPPVEQKKIVEFLEAKLMKLDDMASNVQSVIDRLTEYRTALITAATTGKIDVRHVAIPSPQPLSPTPLPPAGEGLAD